MTYIPPGWHYSIDVLSDLLRACEDRKIHFEDVLAEAKRRNLEDDRDAIGRAGEDGP